AEPFCHWYRQDWGKKKEPASLPAPVVPQSAKLWRENRDCGRGGERHQRSANAHGGHRRDNELATIPRRDDLRRMVRERGHDLRLNVLGRPHKARTIHALRDAAPELDVLGGPARANRGF